MRSWPLTAMQRSMVYQTLHGARPGDYIQQSVCRSEKVVGEARLRQIFDILSARYDAFRLQLDLTDGDISQTITDQVTVPIESRRWPGEQGWNEFLRADRIRGVDLQRAPLMRVTFFLNAPEKTRFVITYHHTILDGRSHKAATTDLFSLIEAPAEPLTPAPHPFSRYLDWMAASDHSGSMPFWREYLAGLPAAEDLRLPEPGTADTLAGGTERGEVAEGVTAALRALAAECGCSLNNIVQAAWAILISRYSGTDEAVFGTTRACRVSAMDGTASDLVGLLINSVPIRVRMPAGTTVRSALKDLRDVQRSLRDHENTPLSQIAGAAGRQGGEALYNSYLMFDEVTTSSYLRGWACELHEQIEMLSLSASASTSIALTLDYDPERYSGTVMARFLDDFVHILTELPGSSDLEIDRLNTFTLSLVIGSKEPKQQFANVVEAVQHWARTTPHKPAIISDAGTMTYAELDVSSNRVAHRLIASGVVPGSLVGISIDRSADLIVAFLAIWKAGGAYLPVDLRYPEEKRAYMLADSRAAILLTSLPDSAGLPPEAPQILIAGESPAYAIYTSGSTGKPKGVLISHASLANLCTGVVDSFLITSHDRVLQASTINFDISVEEIFPTLWKGAVLVPASDDATSSIRDFTDFVEKHQCTVLDMPTAFWHEIVVGIRDSGNHLPDSVRLLIVGGERPLPELFAAWMQAREGKRVRWLNTYGPTEATVTATLYEPPATLSHGSLPIGRPLHGVNTYILDNRLRALPLDVSGELFIGGAGVGIGYLNSPDLTNAKFLPDPFQPGRMYRTGDRARLLSSGEIEFLGRTDHQVKFRSYRIELGEVETAAESHPDVLQAIAQVRGGNVLALYVVTRADSAFESSALLQWLEGKLVEWMVPTAIVLLDKLPLNASGKIDRAALAAMPVHSAQTAISQQPETDLERELLKIWEKLFQKSGFGIDDNFFSLGGYSLLAMRMLIEVEKTTGRPLRFADLNRAPTVRHLAKLVAGDTRASISDCLVVLRENPTGAPLYCMHGAGGVTHWYNDLAAFVTDRPVIGVQSFDDPGKPMPSSVDEMAGNYMEAIRQFQPQGPYYFIGHSMGGMLAYHCAVICGHRGDAVGFVGTLDGWNRLADNPSTFVKVRRLLKYFWGLHLAEKIDFVTEKLKWLQSERTRRQEMSSLDTGNTATLEMIKAHNVRIAYEYVAPRYEGTFYVFRARKRSATQDPDPTLGWARVSKTVVATEVPGTHYTLLSPPNVEVLAAKLNEVLRRST